MVRRRQRPLPQPDFAGDGQGRPRTQAVLPEEQSGLAAAEDGGGPRRAKAPSQGIVAPSRAANMLMGREIDPRS